LSALPSAFKSCRPGGYLVRNRETSDASAVVKFVSNLPLPSFLPPPGGGLGILLGHGFVSLIKSKQKKENSHRASSRLHGGGVVDSNLLEGWRSWRGVALIRLIRTSGRNSRDRLGTRLDLQGVQPKAGHPRAFTRRNTSVMCA
jgi:hypothetical protein